MLDYAVEVAAAATDHDSPVLVLRPLLISPTAETKMSTPLGLVGSSMASRLALKHVRNTDFLLPMTRVVHLLMI